jgi:hypothetical protein
MKGRHGGGGHSEGDYLGTLYIYDLYGLCRVWKEDMEEVDIAMVTI